MASAAAVLVVDEVAKHLAAAKCCPSRETSDARPSKWMKMNQACAYASGVSHRSAVGRDRANEATTVSEHATVAEAFAQV
jgi:hypothetical protein